MFSAPLHSYQEALDIILNNTLQTDAIDISISDCLGHVLAEDVISAVLIPPFDNSAMDGFAIKYADIVGASDSTPVTLSIKSIIAAGDAPLLDGFESGECHQIMTGAPVPIGADTVVPVELVDQKEDLVTFKGAYDIGKHIRKVGTDFARGDTLYKEGQKITSQMIPALCSVGLKTVKVYQKPSTVWLSTGEELTDNAGEALEPGKIFNSSGPYGEAIMPSFGADMKWRRTIPDDLDLFRASLDQADSENIDVVISTGAVSVGIYDFVRSELEAKGWDILLHRAKVKPGKPILFAKLSRVGKRDRFFFGLPGNPVSSAMGLRVFVYPFLRAMQGLGQEAPFKAVLTNEAKAAEGLTVFMKATTATNNQGQMTVTSLDAQQSYQVGAMGHMNAWLIHPEGQGVISAGAVVDCLPVLPE